MLTREGASACYGERERGGGWRTHLGGIVGEVGERSYEEGD